MAEKVLSSPVPGIRFNAICYGDPPGGGSCISEVAVEQHLSLTPGAEVLEVGQLYLTSSMLF